jgi:hypothetical protein
MEYNGTPRIDAFTQNCRDLIRTFTYEDIMACTVYAAPLFFMVGPAAVLAHDPMISVVLQSLTGFAVSWMLHHMGHRLLSRIPKTPQRIFLSSSMRLPVKLSLSQFMWLLQFFVAIAVLSGLLAKRSFLAGGADNVLISMSIFALGCCVFFVPVHLGRLWIKRYYPAMSLVGPTDEVINRSVPTLRSLFK